MLWTLDLAAEIESDMSVFHRIDDPDSLDSSRFCRFVELLPFYDGAVGRRFEIIRHNAKNEVRPAGTRPAPDGAGVKGLIAKAEHGKRSNLPGIEYRGKE